MIVFPNSKINLGLHILGKRNDGYHELETVFCPVQIKDIIEIINAEKQTDFSVTGLPVDGKETDNICLKAYHILKNDFPELPPVRMHLHKAIPIGTGLGGGSADGAFTLMLLNDKFKLGLSKQKLIDYSLKLGSDCPFFIFNKPCYASGRGELLENIELDLSDYKFLIVAPGIQINTGWAFSQLKLSTNPDRKSTIKEIISRSVATWKKDLVNDFEEIIFSKHPEIRSIKEKLYEAGAVYSSMSGSGSAVYGIFKKSENILVSFPSTYFLKESICQ